ncbi:MAG: uracil-DNA glycosylase family protein [Bifidobacterium sp.]|nr:uracil-DNA glycosylase family protein [Bifidobacterium sp.]
MATIEEITKQIEADPANAQFEAEGQKPLFQAPATARINIIGQTPGDKAEEHHRVWDDRSGERLREWLDVDEDTFYNSGMFALLPLDFYFTGHDFHGAIDPRPDFAPKWFPEIIKTMPDIQLTILAGGDAIDYFLHPNYKEDETEVVKNYQEYLPKYFPIIHPSGHNNIWLVEHPWFEQDVIPALRKHVHAILDEK